MNGQVPTGSSPLVKPGSCLDIHSLDTSLDRDFGLKDIQSSG